VQGESTDLRMAEDDETVTDSGACVEQRGRGDIGPDGHIMAAGCIASRIHDRREDIIRTSPMGLRISSPGWWRETRQRILLLLSPTVVALCSIW
jgi:hypothetical protein